MKQQTLVAAIFITASLLAGCNQSTPSIASNIYDVNATIGQKYGEMTLQKIAPALEKRPISDSNLHGEFSGKISLSGEYEYIDSDDGMFIGRGSTCFTVTDPISLQKLPISKVDSDYLKQMPNETPRKFFCFSNSDEKAVNLLGKGKGKATITINKFEDDTFDGEALDTAELESVQK